VNERTENTVGAQPNRVSSHADLPIKPAPPRQAARYINKHTSWHTIRQLPSRSKARGQRAAVAQLH